MGTITKWLAIGVAAAVAALLFQEWLFVILGVVLLLWLIRMAADFFWWMRDNGKV